MEYIKTHKIYKSKIEIDEICKKYNIKNYHYK
jgi:hypothetical protein